MNEKLYFFMCGSAPDVFYELVNELFHFVLTDCNKKMRFLFFPC